ncbi:uncharacterized protein LOC124607420 [Schistocerca americana]|uniref:uncharacterized protein LOC124607420 n=1 Tax=Schistocerca americana TaxID=7009 RepID=UPI001F4F410D|nr:uncharacterized protein LOC124607420 [Schistocerca americana]
MAGWSPNSPSVFPEPLQRWSYFTVPQYCRCNTTARCTWAVGRRQLGDRSCTFGVREYSVRCALRRRGGLFASTADHCPSAGRDACQTDAAGQGGGASATWLT